MHYSDCHIIHLERGRYGWRNTQPATDAVMLIGTCRGHILTPITIAFRENMAKRISTNGCKLYVTGIASDNLIIVSAHYSILDMTLGTIQGCIHFCHQDHEDWSTYMGYIQRSKIQISPTLIYVWGI